MNFAAQLFYSSYLSERLERLYSPRPALKGCEENDPFWQRFGKKTDLSDLSSTPIRPVVRDLALLWGLNPPSSQNQGKTQTPTVPPSISSVTAPTSTASEPLHPPLRLQIPLTNTSSVVKALPLLPSPHPTLRQKSTKPPTCVAKPCLTAVVSESSISELPSDPQQMAIPNSSPAPAKPQVATASSSSSSSSARSSFTSTSTAPSDYRRVLLPSLDVLLDLLLRLILFFILLFIPR